VDLTVAATPGYFASMAVERRVLEARRARQGPSAADYERRDTTTSLAMGVGSLLAPVVLPRVLRPITPGKRSRRPDGSRASPVRSRSLPAASR
jgi:hypothetical protein